MGTTVVRTLESETKLVKSVKSVESVESGKTDLTDLTGSTDLFVFPPYDFNMIDIMITNSHLSKSSLMILVEAFLQFKKSKKSLVELYDMAIKNNFRFYSFGDVMLII